MARTVNYPKRAEKIKEMIDDLSKGNGTFSTQNV